MMAALDLPEPTSLDDRMIRESCDEGRISVRTYYAFHRNSSYRTWGEVARAMAQDEREIRWIRNIGAKAMAEINAELRRLSEAT